MSRTLNDDGSTYTGGGIGVGTDSKGNAWSYAPHPANKLDNSNNLATTHWVRNHCCTTPATTTSTASLDAPCYVIENYVNGTSWYRTYSDKWLEQGGETRGVGSNNGIFTTFLKPFKDTKYTLNLNPYILEVTFINAVVVWSKACNKIATGFTAQTGYGEDVGSNYNISWQTCGY